MSEMERKGHYVWGQENWASWGSPVGLGLFFVLIASAVEIIRLAFK